MSVTLWQIAQDTWAIALAAMADRVIACHRWAEDRHNFAEYLRREREGGSADDRNGS